MKTITIALVAIAVILAGCSSGQAQTSNASNTSQGSSKAEYHKITPEVARKMMQTEKNYIILDVRTEAEYKQQRIDGAKLLPVDEIGSRAEKELPQKNQLIFVYCRSGVRSRNASTQLVGMGYTNIYDIGGIINWPYETVSD